MLLDPAAYLRLEIEGSLGATSTGARSPRRPATSSKSPRTPAARSACASVPTRVPTTDCSWAARALHDVAAEPDAVVVRQRRRDARARRHAAAHAPSVEGRADLHVGHRRALPRLDAPADVRTLAARRVVDRGVRARIRRPRVRARREVRPARQARAARALAGRGCARRQHRALATRTRRSRGARATAAAPGALFVHTPGMVTHGVGHPDWSHRSYAVSSTTKRSISSCSRPTRPRRRSMRYTELTGRAPPVPRWSLGLWVSRAYYKTPEQAIDVAQKLRERRIPCDVLALDGRAAWNTETRFNFEWDADRFPDPKAALAQIRARNLRVCVWEYPYVSVHSRLFRELAQRGYLLKTANGDPYVFAWDRSPTTSPFGSVLTPLPRQRHRRLHQSRRVRVVARRASSAVRRRRRRDQERLRRARAGRRRRASAATGAGGSTTCIRCSTTVRLRGDRASSSAQEDGPPLVWSRAGWTGSQRYPIGWGGEPQSDWEGLAASIRGGLSWGMSGNPYHSSDIGGFYGSEQPSAELYVRWLQATVFASHMRAHGIGEREPWAFGAGGRGHLPQVARVSLSPHSVPRVGDRVATATGMPVMRAMPLAFPDNSLLRNYETQFMCGDALLVAPIVRAGGEVEIALPPGGWFDLNTRQRIAGRQVLRYRAKLDQFPVFAREGLPCRWDAPCSTPARSIAESRSSFCGCSASLASVFRLRAGADRRRRRGRRVQRSRGGRLQRRSVW